VTGMGDNFVKALDGCVEAEKIPVYADPDIGQCDWCGSDEGRRVRRWKLTIMPDGTAARVGFWLCRPCRSDFESGFGSAPVKDGEQ